MARISYEAAYPRIDFLPRSRNWWAWLKGSPAECIHLDNHAEFVATVLPDTLYLRGKRAPRRDPLVGERERHDAVVVPSERVIERVGGGRGETGRGCISR